MGQAYTVPIACMDGRGRNVGERYSWKLILLGGFLLCTAAVLDVQNQLTEREAAAYAETILEAFLCVAEERDAGITGEIQNVATVVSVQDDEYIGILEIPALELVLPVHTRYSEENLQKTPCRYAGTLETEDLVIAGHNYSSHFGGLGSLKAGDEVRFSEGFGSTYIFRVEQILTVEADSAEELREGEYPLTLFTCTYGGQARIVIRCRWLETIS